MQKRWQLLMVPATLVTALVAVPSTNARVVPAASLQMINEGPAGVVVSLHHKCVKKDPGNCIKCSGQCAET